MLKPEGNGRNSDICYGSVPRIVTDCESYKKLKDEWIPISESVCDGDSEYEKPGGGAGGEKGKGKGCGGGPK
jgi:hypothetical protein